MDLTDRFHLDVPLERAWGLLVDLERVAPCVPGAELQEVAGDDHRGVVRVRAGPVTIQYRGTATFVDVDRGAHRIVLRAEGGDSRGNEKGSAMVTATLREAGAGTDVGVAIDLSLAGRVARMPRAVVADGGRAAGPTAVAAVSVRPPPAPPIDLLALAGGSVTKRALPALTSMGAMWLLRRRRRAR